MPDVLLAILGYLVAVASGTRLFQLVSHWPLKKSFQFTVVWVTLGVLYAYVVRMGC